MENYIVVAILFLVIGGAVFYVLKQRKKGVKCIGCPNGSHCPGDCCSCKTDKK